MTEFGRLGATSLCRAPQLGQDILWLLGIFHIRSLWQKHSEQIGKYIEIKTDTHVFIRNRLEKDDIHQ